MITEEVLVSALRGEWNGIRSIPKTDLHAHMLLSVPFDSYRKAFGKEVNRPPERFSSLSEFLQYLRSELIPNFSSVEIQRTLFRDCLQHMISDGIVYTELAFDYMMAVSAKTSWEELIKAFTPEIEAVKDKIKVRCDFGLARELTFPNLRESIVSALGTGFFTGIDLYGEETSREVNEFGYFFDEARKRGIKIKIHSGETGDPERVLRELRFVKPDGIQHGIRASEAAEALEYLVRLGIPANVCPFSNYQLSCIDDYNKHPIRKMYDVGVKVTLNTDDFGVFGRSLSEEYVRLFEAKVLTADQLEVIRQNGLRMSQGR